MLLSRIRFCVAGMVLLGAARLASAGTSTLFGGNDLVVFGNMSGQGDVEGTAIIGGNLTGNAADFATKLTASLPTDINLLVGGNVTAGENLDYGSAVVGGNVSQYINHNQSGSTVTQNNAPAAANLVLTPLKASMQAASQTMAGLVQSPLALISSSGANSTFTTTGGSVAGQMVVYDVTDTSLFKQNAQIDLASSLSSAGEVIINVDVTNPGDALSISSSINFKADDSALGNVVWNFYHLNSLSAYDTTDAMTLSVPGAFYGALLAPYATLSNGNFIDGSVGVANFNQGGEVHMPVNTIPLTSFQTTTAAAPEPTTLAAGAVGLIGLVIWRGYRGRYR